MKLKGNNKGFSLVELIIVIAIMAILVGILAPNLIKQIEKARVSSDLEFCDAVRSAVIYAMTDIDVMNDRASEQWINWFTMKGDNSAGGYSMQFTCGDCKFKESIIDTLGFDVFDETLRKEHIKSSAAAHGGDLFIYVTNENFYIGILHSDRSGLKQDIARDVTKNIIAPLINP